MTDNWNVEALKVHIDALFTEFSKGIDYRFEAIKQAIEKSDAYASYRDAKQNEFQGALNDAGKRADEQAKQFANKTDVQNLDKQFEIWMSGIKQLMQANFDVLSDKIGKCEKAIERIENTKRGSLASWGWIVAIITTLIAIVSFIIK